MPIWKSLLLHLYYHGGRPLRVVRNRRAAAAGRAAVMVLMYHRVADDLATPWTISNRTFARQIDWLARHFDLVSLSEAQRRIREGNRRPSISITFDDGYAENCDAALPLLVERNIPCTYYVASDFIHSGQGFPHDVKLGVAAPPNTPRQLADMASSGIELGGHTLSHADLGRIDDADQLRHEMAGGARALEQITGRPVRHFAFPYGQHVNLSSLAFRVARDIGFETVVSAYGGLNFPGDDSFHLQRIPVDNDLIRLKNWVTVDPRKLRITRRFRD